MVGDRRRRYSFYRDRQRHQKAIDQAWQETGGTSTYLGEWHTHPEDIPIPSDTDVKNWKCRLKEDIFSGNALYFIIIGIENLRIWEGSKSSLSCELIGEFFHLEECNVEDEYSQ